MRTFQRWLPGMIVIIVGLLAPTPVWEHRHPIFLVALLIVVGVAWTQFLIWLEKAKA